MKILSSLVLTLCSVLGFSQTILYQQESSSRTVQDPQTVILAPGFKAVSSTSNPFVAKIGPATDNPGGGPVDSNAGANNPSGGIAPQGQSFHDTKGNIDVNGGGQLQFTLPVALPPGVKSVAPQVNLVYTSGSGNGIAGYGWNVSGITAITRISQNIYKDGDIKGIQLDYSDYYSFNGQRLILKSGEYGKNGAEYVTEKYSNTRIKSIGTITGKAWEGPEFWEVTFENGSQAWYGAITSGNSTARTPLDYNIVKWKDVQGNYITYNYVQSDNVAVVTTINWGGNELLNKPHFNRIEFIYFAQRNLKEINYLKGEKFIQNRILKEIKVTSNQNKFKRYTVEYTGNGTSYQFVNKITEYNGDDEAANPISIEYEQNQAGSEETSFESNIANTNTKKYADFDLDGTTDYIEYIPTPSSSPNGPVGIINLRNSVYKALPFIPLTYDLSKFTASEFAKAVPITFKKDNFVKNSVGIVVPHKLVTTDPKKPNFEFQVYSLDTQNLKLNLEYSKIIPYDQYSLGDSNDDDLPLPNCTYSQIIIPEMLSYDYNGDGISEILVNFRRTRTCTGPDTGGPVTGASKTETDYLRPAIDSSNTEYSDSLVLNPENPEGDNIHEGSTRTTYNSSMLFDLDENLAVNKSIYKFNEAGGGGNKLDFADFNGDGIQEIIIKKNSEFSKVFNIKRDNNFNYSENNIGNFAGQNFVGMAYTGMLFGDFNGDSKTDILIPQADKSYSWNLYISDGTKFNQSTINNFIYYSSGNEVLMESSHNGDCTFSESRYFQYNVADLDADGKSDIVVSYVFINNHKWNAHHDQEKTVLRTFVYSVNKTTTDNTAIYAKKFLSSAGGDYNVNLLSSPIETNGDLNFYRVRDWRKEYAEKVIPFGTLNLNRINQQIISIGRPDDCSGVNGCNYNYVQQYNYTYIPVISRIKSIKQGELITNVYYKDFNPADDSNFYRPIKKEKFPYYELDKVPFSSTVYQLKQVVGVDKELIQDFRYRGAVSHLQGKGMMGSRQTARSSFYAVGFENTKIWTGTEVDPLNEGLPIKEWSIRTNDENKIFPEDISENNTQLLSFRSTNYKIDKLLNGAIVTTESNTDKAKIVTAIVPTTVKNKDFLKNILSVDSISYGDYYLPAENVTNINGTFATFTTKFGYINNPNGQGKDYYIGRFASKVEEKKAYSDTQLMAEHYTYDKNLLKTTTIIAGTDINNYTLDEYLYDSFGNLVEKKIRTGYSSNIRTEKSQYDPQGRFVVKKIDNLGLETNILYNDWGLITKQTDPLGNTLDNTYDKWGKLLTSKTNLAGMTTYQYVRDNNSNTAIVQYDPNGNISKKFTNKLGQEYKNQTKGFGDNKYVAIYTMYDILGRKIRESEPYFDQVSEEFPLSGLQWNVISYNDTVYPAKITTTGLAIVNYITGAIDSSTGKKMEISISGNTTTTKEINGYGRTTTKTTDALGNVISTTDKGGTIQFAYNARGQQIKAQYAENIVTTKYDVWGRKSEFNDPSNGLYKYEYDGFGQIAKITSPKGTKEYIYNSLSQLISQKEISTVDNGQSTDKIISYSYDNKGRIISKTGTSKGKSFSSSISYDQQGRVVSSYESSNGKYFIQKGINYDDKGMVISSEKSLYSSGILTKVNIENVYNTWNGKLYQIKDKLSGKILWELKDVNTKGLILNAKLGASDITNKYDGNGFLSTVNHSSQIKPSIIQLGYTFDGVKNELKSRVTGGDFNITELFDYDTNNRLISWTDPVTGTKPVDRNVYDVKGRITKNDQMGIIKYPSSGKIYQPTGMTLNAEGIQNYTNDLIQNINYNENNDPIFIDGEKGDVAFQYGLTSMRRRVTYGGNFSADGDGKFTKFYSEDGSFEIIKDNSTGKEKHILYIGGNPYESNIIYLKDYNDSNGSYKFLHKDYLGSILAISDEAGNKLEQRHFDAWGNFTHLQIGNGSIITDKNTIKNTSLLIDRGYTSHEHFAEVGIIHMNGRLYDPLLKRFLNADENIQDPTNTQNYNKYGYVMNNPLMYNDPSGEFIFESALLSAVVIGAMIASFSYTIAVSISGQNWDLGQFVKTTLFGAISGAVTFGIGSIFSTSAGAATQIATELGKAGTVFLQGTIHAMAQGILSMVQGQDFGSAFASGFFGSLGASAFGAVAGKFANSTIGTVAFGAVSGGIGSELTGGNFWQGAVIGGIVAGLNHTFHIMKGIDDSNGPGPKKKITVNKKIAAKSRLQKFNEFKEYVLKHLTVDAEGYVDAGPQIEVEGKLLGVHVGLGLEGRHTEKMGFQLGLSDGKISNSLMLLSQSDNSFGWGIGIVGMEDVYVSKMFKGVSERTVNIGPISYKVNYITGQQSINWTPMQLKVSAILGISGKLDFGWKW